MVGLQNITPSNSNDDCHRDIMNLSARDAERFFKAHARFPESFHFCASCGSPRPLLASDLDANSR